MLFPGRPYSSFFRLTGTCGVGIGKKEYLEKEMGKEAVQIMKLIKKIVDPFIII